jgi:hypothetical protein
MYSAAPLEVKRPAIDVESALRRCPFVADNAYDGRVTTRDLKQTAAFGAA